MIHFRCISIINHWYMTVIHLLEFRTLYWQGLQLVSWILDPECPQLWVEFWFLAMLATDKSWSWRRFDYSTLPSIDSAINAVDRECINYLSDTDTELKMLSRHSRISNLESFHQIQHNSTMILDTWYFFSIKIRIMIHVSLILPNTAYIYVTVCI